MGEASRPARFFAAALPLLGAAAWALRGPIAAAAARFPACRLRALTGLWCPACGNTRSVLCLLRGDLFGALRCNPAPPVLALCLAGLYVELLCRALGRPRRVLPRAGAFWFTVLGAFFAYCAARNFIPGLLPR